LNHLSDLPWWAWPILALAWLAGVFRIILTNAVKYVTNLESYDRRIQSAINLQGKKMPRRAGFLLIRAPRRAGSKLPTHHTAG